MTRSAWPTNLGAYLRTAVGLPLTGAVGALASQSYAPEDLAAAAGSLAGDVGVLLTGEHQTGWRRYLKPVCSWAGTAVGTVFLATARYEGVAALSLGTFGQLSTHDGLTISLLAVKSILQTVVPNLPARYADVVGEIEEALDTAAPETADLSGGTVGHELLNTATLTALTPEYLARMAAQPAAVPAQPTAPTVEATGAQA